MSAVLNLPAAALRGRLTDSRIAREFVLAGNARVTLVSTSTGNRFTYKVRRPVGNGKPHFVSLLRGPNNEEDYTFLGTIFPDGHFVLGRQRLIGDDAPSARAFRYAWTLLRNYAPLPINLEIWHEGRCGRCARPLTVPESIARGFGPECAGILGELRQGKLV